MFAVYLSLYCIRGVSLFLFSPFLFTSPLAYLPFSLSSSPFPQTRPSQPLLLGTDRRVSITGSCSGDGRTKRSCFGGRVSCASLSISCLDDDDGRGDSVTGLPRRCQYAIAFLESKGTLTFASARISHRACGQELCRRLASLQASCSSPEWLS